MAASRSRDVLLFLIGAVVALFGVAFTIGGGWLVSVGGTWYYLLAGLAMIVSGLLLITGRRAGVGIYVLVFIGTLLWTLWEAGGNYWGWIPRMDVVIGLGVAVALAAPSQTAS